MPYESGNELQYDETTIVEMPAVVSKNIEPIKFITARHPLLLIYVGLQL